MLDQVKRYAHLKELVKEHTLELEPLRQELMEYFEQQTGVKVGRLVIDGFTLKLTENTKHPFDLDAALKLLGEDTLKPFFGLTTYRSLSVEKVLKIMEIEKRYL